MKITKRQLRRIIKEERSRLLKEQWGGEETGSPLLVFAKAYASLGQAVQEQVDAVVGAYINERSADFKEVVYEQNPNAIDMAMDRVGRLLRGYGDLGDEGDTVLEALEAAQEIFEAGDAEVEADASAAGDR